MINWLIRLLGGVPYNEYEEELNEEVTLKRKFKAIVDDYESANEKLHKDKRKAAAELDRIKRDWGKDQDKLKKALHSLDIEKRGHGRMRQRNNRARKFMAEVELRSTKGIGVKWFDYMSYKVSGADLLKVLDILDGDRDWETLYLI